MPQTSLDLDNEPSRRPLFAEVLDWSVEVNLAHYQVIYVFIREGLERNLSF